VGLNARMFAASGALAVVVGAAFGLLLSSIGDLRGSGDKAEHSEQVLAAANHLETVVLDLETGARGFVITRQTRFLEPWTSGLKAFPSDGAALETLVRDNPSQEARARAIVRAGNLYISEYSKPLVFLARRASPQASTLVATGAGKQRVDAMRAQFNRFVAAENLLLLARRSAADSSSRKAEEVGIGGLIGATLLIFLFAVYLARAVVVPVRRASAAAARLARGDLAARVAEGGGGEVAELGRSFNTMASAIANDVENRNRAERERERLEEQLRQSAKMEAVGNLAGGIAHDFNNLLLVIRGYAAVVMKRNVDETLVEGLHHIDDAAERAGELTRQLLAFSRQQVLRPEVTNLNDVVTETLNLLERLIGTNIAIETTLEPDLHPIVVDRSQLGQVILNLAVNARDAMPEGGSLTIQTSNLRLDAPYVFDRVDIAPGSYALLQMTDTGVGMDEATRRRVFDPFFTTKSEGTGLGLATVYGIVKQSGGSILLYSEPRLGTTFKIYFPEETRDAFVASPAPSSTSLRGSETILLVEDDAVVRPLIAEILELYGYAVVPAAGGEEAIEIVKHQAGSIDLLLSDIVMPGMNGRELADTLCAEYPALKVVFTSGYPADTTVRNGLRETNMAFIEKPYLPDDLARFLRGVLDSRES
jgi:signal transduction histidine kinase/ActR/RegA family two-component response regulator